MPAPNVVRHFDSVASDYGGFRSRWPLSVARRQEWRAISAAVDVRPGQRVLDAGCGDGEFLDWLQRCGARPIGIDASPAMAARCRTRGFAVSVQDLQRPAFRPVFDWVLCFGALEFTDDPTAAIAAMAGVLRPGGRIAVLFPRRNAVGTAYVAYHLLAHGFRVRLFGEGEVEATMHAGGLGEIKRTDLSLSALCVATLAPPEAASEAMRKSE